MADAVDELVREAAFLFGVPDEADGAVRFGTKDEVFVLGGPVQPVPDFLFVVEEVVGGVEFDRVVVVRVVVEVVFFGGFFWVDFADPFFSAPFGAAEEEAGFAPCGSVQRGFGARGVGWQAEVYVCECFGGEASEFHGGKIGKKGEGMEKGHVGILSIVMKYTVFIYILILMGGSCARRTAGEDGEAVAKAYCDCLVRHDFSDDYYLALTKCDTEAVLESRMYARYYMRMFYGGPSVAHLPASTLDSLNAFRDHFLVYLKKAQPLLFERRPAGAVR